MRQRYIRKCPCAFESSGLTRSHLFKLASNRFVPPPSTNPHHPGPEASPRVSLRVSPRDARFPVGRPFLKPRRLCLQLGTNRQRIITGQRVFNLPYIYLPRFDTAIPGRSLLIAQRRRCFRRRQMTTTMMSPSLLSAETHLRFSPHDV